MSFPTVLRPLAVLLPLAAAPLAAAAQTALPDAVRAELQKIRSEHEAALERLQRDYETRLRDLEARVQGAETKAAAAERKAAAPAPAPAPAEKSGSGFNPQIGVVLDGKFTNYRRDPSSYRIPGFALGNEAGLDPRGLALGESEVSFSANIDQALYGNLTLAFTRDGETEVEEAFLQSTALPWGVTAKAGRFFSGIGYMNEQHAHTWDFADAPLPYRAFLANQLRDDGVQFRWLAPTNVFLEFGGEALRGDSFPAGGAGNRGAGQFSAFVHAGDDLGTSHSVRGGLSWLRSIANDRETGDDRFSGRSNTGIVDFVYKWAPDGNATQTNFKLQGEYFVRREEGDFNALGYSGTQSGWYAQAVYQFMPRWRVGLRHDEVKASGVDAALAGTVLDNLGTSPRRNSAMLDYSTSEFGRFRLQYNRDQSRPDADDQFILQYTVSLGAHGAHPF